MPVLGSVEQVADAAYVYVSAREIVRNARRVFPEMQVQVDAALHDLTLCCGFPCDCSEGCEGLILS